MMLKKILFFLGVLTFAKASGQSAITCYSGVVAYDITNSTVYRSINVTEKQCGFGEICGQYHFLNTDENGRSSIVVGFCINPLYPHDCLSSVSANPNVGTASNCTFTSCNTNNCNRFPTNVCNNGTLYYDTSETLVTFRYYAGYVGCSAGHVCGMYRLNSITTQSNYTNYVEIGTCVHSNATINCTDLNNVAALGEISNCMVEMGEGATAPRFTQQVPLNRGYRCDLGTFAYTTDMQHVVFAENITDKPCAINQVCGMFRWQNTDDKGNRSYVESGFCIPPAGLLNLSCDSLSQYPNVNNPENCSLSACSGDYCESFSVFNTPTEAQCPGRPPIGDLQILPGCSMSHVLSKSFTCMAEYATAFPYPSPENCSGIIDRAINCSSNVVQECIRYQHNSMNLCPSILDSIPGLNISPILKLVRNYAMNISSLDDLQAVLENLTNNTISLNELDLICNSTREQMIMGLEMLRNLVDGVEIGLGMPVCSDNKILDDLIQWSIEFFEEQLNATTSRDGCLSFDKFKARIDDAIRHRCYGLDRLGSVLPPIVGSQYVANIIQRAVDIAKIFLLRLEVPGCEDVPYPTHLVCNQGTVVYRIDDRYYPLLDQSNRSICPPNHSCGMYRWDNIDPQNQKAYVEFGICTYRGSESSYTCDSLLNDPNVTRIENCKFSSCNASSHRCEMFNKDKCPVTSESDVAILPRCSLSTSLERGFECLGPFAAGYPYSDHAQCRMQVDSAVRCARDVARRCLSGDCETVLDFIPNLRDFYRQFIQASSNINSLADGLKMLGLNDQIIKSVYGGICGDEKIREEILTLLENLQNLNLTMDNPVCDGNIVNDLVRWGIGAARAILMAQTHSDFCSAFSTLRINLMNAWQNRCSQNALITYLNSLSAFLPPQFRGELVKGIAIVQRFFSNLQIPNCNSSTGLINCAPFYEGTSQCAMRRAWLCDYVNWKVEFLSTWLGSFQNYLNNNMIVDVMPLIEECMNFDSTNFCTDSSQLVCRLDQQNCRFCYCRDHRYTNLSRVTEIYRRDWMRWRRAFSRYQRVTAQNTCSMN